MVRMQASSLGLSYGRIVLFCTCLSSLFACSSSVPVSPYGGKRSGNGSAGVGLPSDGGLGNVTAGSGEARFAQIDVGAVYKGSYTATLSGGNLHAKSTTESIEITLNGLRTNDERARDSVQASNGTSRFARVLYGNLPDLPRYKQHAYLMFATSASNAKGDVFNVIDGNPFPVFPFALGSRDSYANIQYGAQTYTSLISHAGKTEQVTFQVARKPGSVLASCDPKYFSLINTVLADSNYLALELTVSKLPDEWMGKFPLSDSVYVISFQNGGVLSHVGICSVMTYETTGDSRGAITFAAQR